DGEYPLTIILNGNGHVTSNPSGSKFSSGQLVTLAAIPDARQDFVGWSGGAAGTQNPLTVTMNSNKVIVANFTTRPNLGTSFPGTTTTTTLPGGRVITTRFYCLEQSPDGFRLLLTGEFGDRYSIAA